MDKAIYIAGKVTGEPLAEVTMKFGSAYTKIQALGFIAINPLEVVGTGKTITWDEAMKQCIMALLKCDGVVLLPDWEQSEGARFEREIAEKLNIPIFGYNDFGLKVMVSNLKQ